MKNILIVLLGAVVGVNLLVAIIQNAQVPRQPALPPMAQIAADGTVENAEERLRIESYNLGIAVNRLYRGIFPTRPGPASVPAPAPVGAVGAVPDPCVGVLNPETEIHVGNTVYVLDGFPAGQRAAIAQQLRSGRMR